MSFIESFYVICTTCQQTTSFRLAEHNKKQDIAWLKSLCITVYNFQVLDSGMSYGFFIKVTACWWPYGIYL